MDLIRIKYGITIINQERMEQNASFFFCTPNYSTEKRIEKMILDILCCRNAKGEKKLCQPI